MSTAASFFPTLKTMKGSVVIVEFYSTPTMRLNPVFLLEFIVPSMCLAPVGAKTYSFSGKK
jgi:hypothetical protein